MEVGGLALTGSSPLARMDQPRGNLAAMEKKPGDIELDILLSGDDTTAVINLQDLPRWQ